LQYKEERMIELLIALGLSVLINAVFFVFAASFRTDKVTDLSYSLSFVVLAVLLLIRNGTWSPLHLAAALMIVVWGLRLGSYLFARILRTGVDHRFDAMRDNIPRFAMFWILQAFTVWAVMLPAIRLFTFQSALPIGPVSAAGIAVWSVGFVMEIVSDLQKSAFKSDPGNKGKFIATGLWKYSRHPNYLGESLAWWGLFLAIVPAFSGWDFLTAAGPLFLTVMLLFVSGIPLLEKSARERWGSDPAWQEYTRRTSVFLILPRRR
jgi:steroid 5-alpha reductase family enzyme